MNQVEFRPRAKPKRRGGVWAVLLALIVVAAGGYGWMRHREAAAPAPSATAAAPRPVPVQIATASTAPFPVNLTGLGTVQAYNTVVVRSRVDGQIEKVGFREGQMVHEGDVLVEIDPRPYQAALDQARAKKVQDEATLTNAKADLQRYTKLGDYATRQQLDTQTATVNQVTAQIAADQAAIDNAQTQLGYATIRAPITGLAGFRQVDIGNIVNAATQTGIVTLTQLEPISVVFTAPEEQLPDINAALAAGQVPVAALSGDGSRKLSEGRLEIVNNQVDTASGTIRLKATFENKDHALWPGLSVTTRTRIRTIEAALTVPDGAVQRGPDGLFVFTVAANDRAHPQKIETGASDEGRTVVTKGLDPGQKVVAQGQYRVQDNTLVAGTTPRVQQADAEGR